MKYLFTLLLVFTCAVSEAQRLRTGDTLAPLVLSNVINYTNDRIEFEQLRGKLIILDFWQTSCTQCIKGFKKLDSLQNQFSEFVQIIAVNNESKDSTERFFAKRKNIILPRIPFVTEDKILSKFFPRNFAPWLVWIDRNGVVRYTTDAKSVNEKTITDFLAGRTPEVKQVQYSGIQMLKGE